MIWRKAQLAVAAMTALASAAHGAGTVSTDGSVGRATSLAGPGFAITSDLGKQVGPNLFHSFNTFTLVKGETATFSGPPSVTNVIARVTGGRGSSIDGTLQCTIPGANFYLINPSGVLFGPDAMLDVKGSFVVTTADYLKLADGSRFNATHVSDSTLSSAAPAAFGFLVPRPAPIVVNGSNLLGAQGQAVSLIGGNVQIVNGIIRAPAGRVNVISTASSGELAVDATSLLANLDLTNSAAAMGDVSMTSSTISVAGAGASGPGGGRVSVRAATFEMVDSIIVATSAGAADGLGVDVAVTGTFSLVPGIIVTDTSGTGRAGPISITASAVTIDGTGLPPLETAISASSFSAGRGGDIRIQTGALSIIGGSALFADAFGAGDAGTISINATGDVHADGVSRIVTATFGAGNGGNISIAAGSLELTNGATITASTSGTGNAGNISIDAGTIAIDDAGGGQFTIGIVANSLPQGAAGDAGKITINSNSLSVTQGAIISAYSNGNGAAGAITIKGGSITLDEGTSPAFTGIFTASFNPTGGPSGPISINGTQMQVLSGAIVDSGCASNTAVGNISVNVTDLTLDNRGSALAPFGSSGIFAESNSPSGSAMSGRITVTANTITVLGGGLITADGTSGANGGTVSIAASRSLTLDGQGMPVFTGISADAVGAGSAGKIQIIAGTAAITGGALVSAGALDSGAAGTVSLAVTQLLTLDGQSLHLATGILADNNDGLGGAVQITGGDLAMQGGAEMSATSFGAGTGGTIAINVHAMNLQGVTGSRTMINAGALGTGNAGSITVTSSAITVTGVASIFAETSGTATAGVVNLSTGSLILNGTGGVATIDAATNGAGDAGVVNIQAIAVQVLNGSTINASTLSSGHGGVVNVNADSLTVDRGASPNITGVLSQSTGTTAANPGAGGTVNLHAGTLVINNNAVIDATTFGAGAAGGINVTADSILLMNGGSITSNTQGQGAAGNITIQAGSLQILGSSQITSDTLSAAAGGNVSVTVTGALTIDAQSFTGPSATGITASSSAAGNAGNLIVQAGSLIMRNHGTIESDSEGGTGSAGKVNVSAGSISLQSTSVISSGTFGDGAGGDVAVTGKQITLDAGRAAAFTGITAQTNAAGHAGAVHVNADSLLLINGGEISSTTFASGTGGSVYIVATDLTLRNNSTVDSASTQSGSAGTVNVQLTGALRLFDSQITSQSLKVSGGGITLFAGDSIQLRKSRITTQAGGEGGTIDLRCPGVIDLMNSKILTQAGANGGNMTIDPSFVILENSHLSANGGINGGNISVHPDFLFTSQSTITATGALGVSGTLQITPDYNLAGALLSLPVSLSDSLTLQPQCAADLPEAFSSFIVTGRGGEPLNPGGYSPAFNLRLPPNQQPKD